LAHREDRLPNESAEAFLTSWHKDEEAVLVQLEHAERYFWTSLSKKQITVSSTVSGGAESCQ